MGANSGGTGKIENKTQDEDKQNKKDNTEIQKDDQHGPRQTVGSGMGAQFQNMYDLSNGFTHLFSATFLLKTTKLHRRSTQVIILHDFSTYIGLT